MALAIINLPLSASLQTRSASSALVSVLVELFLNRCVSSEAPRTRHTKYIKTAARLFKTSAEDREEEMMMMMMISSLG